jgi:hypothetical protein
VRKLERQLPQIKASRRSMKRSSKIDMAAINIAKKKMRLA